MPWFKVDDGLSMKAETTRIPRIARTSAIGLLALAGSWSARELTDGHIPAHMLEELCGTESEADWLVTAGFWMVVADGWQFIEWAPDQPLREVVLGERAKRAEKMRGWRQRNRPSSSATDAVTNADRDGDTTPSVTPAPSQSRPDPDQSKIIRPPKADYTNEFDQWWAIYPRKQAKADAIRAYTAARKKVDASTLLDAVRTFALLRVGEDKEFIKLPAGWIRGERWNDEPLARTNSAASPGNISTEERMCVIHPDYPDTTWLPCAACQRAAELPAGADF
jgi:hypothetical protein